MPTFNSGQTTKQDLVPLLPKSVQDTVPSPVEDRRLKEGALAANAPMVVLAALAYCAASASEFVL